MRYRHPSIDELLGPGHGARVVVPDVTADAVVVVR
jgi:hypothetical protein